MRAWFIIVLLLSASLYSCNQQPELTHNPAAPGFDFDNSDPAAVELADSIMSAMGGRENWDKTGFISWNFFGRRDLVWDKKLDRVRIESPGDSLIYLVNVNTGEGRVQHRGEEITNPDSLQMRLKEAKDIWINDSYWLVMPFKLKDTGVTLKYLGETMDSVRYNIMQLTFKEVGNTPQNKYLLYVDLSDNLVKQWAFFRDASQDSATFVLPWDNYKRYGKILLSGDRTGGRGPRDVRVDDSLPDALFSEF